MCFCVEYHPDPKIMLDERTSLAGISLDFPDNYQDFATIDVFMYQEGNETRIASWSIQFDDVHFPLDEYREDFKKASKRSFFVDNDIPQEFEGIRLDFEHDCKFAAFTDLVVYYYDSNATDAIKAITSDTGYWERESSRLKFTRSCNSSIMANNFSKLAFR